MDIKHFFLIVVFHVHPSPITSDLRKTLYDVAHPIVHHDGMSKDRHDDDDTSGLVHSTLVWSFLFRLLYYSSSEEVFLLFVHNDSGQ